MDAPWRIELLGWLRAIQGGRVVSRFRSQKAAALLAYLAYHHHRSHPREALIELLWPESDPEAGRRNLRVELTSLRRQLEVSETDPGGVIVADRATVQLSPACLTDVAQFEATLQAAAGSDAENGTGAAATAHTPGQPFARTSITLRELEPVGGAVPLGSSFYVIRATDAEFAAAMARRDSLVLVKGTRQVGKSSLLVRALQQARQAGARVVLTDLQMFNAVHLASPEALLLTLAQTIADQLQLHVAPTEVWDTRRGPNPNFRRYLEREALGTGDAPLVWGLDQVDRLFYCDFGSEVFGLFRSWHNERALDPAGPWSRLTLAMAYATEAHLFITDVDQSPFNVGTRLTLADFTLEQTAELNRRHGSPLKDEEEVSRFHRLVDGHPYLVRRGLHELATHGLDITTFEARAGTDHWIFGDHLRRMLVLLTRDPELCEVVRALLQGRPCPTPESFYRLWSAGVVTGDSEEDARLRCPLYATYLRRHLS
jgi:hypothetical protein